MSSKYSVSGFVKTPSALGVIAINDLMPHKSNYRRYSRQIFKNPTLLLYHRQRIQQSLVFSESEPLQGSLADMFYGCWYEMPQHGETILQEVKGRLRPDVVSGFEACLVKKSYVERISTLATRWSVLVMPSMDVALHRLRVSSDDARLIAKQVCSALLDGRKRDDMLFIEHKEHEFFSHCLACEDRLAFSLVWFQLAKQGWEFDSRWADCREKLE